MAVRLIRRLEVGDLVEVDGRIRMVYGMSIRVEPDIVFVTNKQSWQHKEENVVVGKAIRGVSDRTVFVKGSPWVCIIVVFQSREGSLLENVHFIVKVDWRVTETRL